VDSFGYGKPARGGRPSSGIVLVAGGVIVVLALAFGIFQATKSGGEQVVRHVRQDLHQVDTAGDAQAQAALTTALTAARTAFVESASYAGADANSLAAIEPSLRYVAGASSGPSVVSVAATATDWGAAVLSRSGTCFYLHASSAGGTSYGSGRSCTGQAAMAASSPSF
jgi:hypothetical protein